MAPGPIGIVFDLDDTLYLERDYARSGFAAVADRLGVEEFAAAAWGVFDHGDRTRIFDRALPAVGIAPAPTLIADLVRCYRDHAPAISLAPDAQRFLDRWPADQPLALLTDGFHRSQRNKVAALGLDSGRLDPVVFTDAWGRDYWKPHRRGFECIAEALGLPLPSLVYVADNPAKDFVAPNRLGWRTVQIARPGGVHHGNPPAIGGQPQAVIQSLDELDEVLGRAVVEPRPAGCQGGR